MNKIRTSFLSACLLSVVFACPEFANAQALSGGQVGEIQASTVLVGSAVTLTTTATAYNLTSVTLPNGHWACQSAGFITAAGTTQTLTIAAWNTVSATLPATPGVGFGYTQQGSNSTTQPMGFNSGIALFDFASPTVVYAVVQSSFTGTAPTAYGQASCWRRG